MTIFRLQNAHVHRILSIRPFTTHVPEFLAEQKVVDSEILSFEAVDAICLAYH